jgi:uncharacterized protein (DUF433 family)
MTNKQPYQYAYFCFITFYRVRTFVQNYQQTRIMRRPPTIRGMRIRVTDVLDLLSNGLSFEEIIEELPDLEKDDIRACLVYTAKNQIHKS